MWGPILGLAVAASPADVRVEVDLVRTRVGLPIFVASEDPALGELLVGLDVEVEILEDSTDFAAARRRAGLPCGVYVWRDDDDWSWDEIGRCGSPRATMTEAERSRWRSGRGFRVLGVGVTALALGLFGAGAVLHAESRFDASDMAMVSSVGIGVPGVLLLSYGQITEDVALNRFNRNNIAGGVAAGLLAGALCTLPWGLGEWNDLDIRPTAAWFGLVALGLGIEVGQMVEDGSPGPTPRAAMTPSPRGISVAVTW